MKESVLILGGAGFIGSNLCNSLISDYDIISLDFQKSSRINQNVQQYEYSMKQIDEIEKLIISNNIRTIIHCISSVIPSSNVEQYLNDIKNIYMNTIRILEICVKYNVKFVFLSSGGVIYENSSRAHKETDNVLPLSFYAVSKLNMEQAILFYHNKFNLKYIILRPSNPYGFGQKMDGKQGVISTLIKKTINNETFEIWGDGNSVRDYIYIKDFAFIVLSLLKKNICNTIINIGSGIGTSVFELIEIIEKISSKKISIRKNIDADLPIKNNVLDISYLLSIIDFTPTKIEDGICSFYKELLSKGGLE